MPSLLRIIVKCYYVWDFCHSHVKEKLKDILLAVSWREIARNYFEHPASWLYQKLDNMDGDGEAGGFTPAEKAQLREALYDLSRRIRSCADAL